MLSFSIIIPTYGGRTSALLRRTLASLAEAARPESLKQLIVVENGPAGDARTVCSEFGARLPLVYAYEPIASSSGARNAGAEMASGDILVFFDDDIRVDPDALVAYDRAFQAHGTGCFYGGPTRPEYERPPDPELVPFMPYSVNGFELPGHPLGEMNRAHRFLGANHAVPRKTFRDTQGYDAHGAVGVNAGAVGEETRLQDRMINQGIPAFYVPGALVWHHVPADACTMAWLETRYFRYGYTDAIVEESRGPMPTTIMGVPRWLLRARFELGLSRVRLALTNAPRARRIKARLTAREFAGRHAGFRDVFRARIAGQPRT